MNNPQTTPALLPCVEVEWAETSTHAVIWMHGLGADGHDFEPVVREFDKRKFPAVRFVFPHAPTRPVTINNGYAMPAWYDLVSLDFNQRREDPAGVAESARQIEALIARENARGIPDEKIVLAGFSQGGAIALYTALRHRKTLAGILALSTYLPLADTLAAEASDANREIPIFMAHGHDDGVIPYGFAQQSAEFMQDQGYALEWHDYPMEHTLTMDEIRDIETWLVGVLV
ncbi:alpha/beta fold hydrolase [Uliginosibacterium sp. H3]|uniref:Alpha/beta fold hydrolase n=1 Tax=Uliginosibacterium silvisoli TaxID=3114758 RepID=A0ABU6K9L8_9RHOO|nr:alpha/beta fold hydrolase [Uliginosibacterium sp. H3]